MDETNEPSMLRTAPRPAGEQAGPASWSDRVPAAGEPVGETAGRMYEVKAKVAHKASELAHQAGEEVQQVVGRKKDETAERIGRVADAIRQAARSLEQQDPRLPRLFEAAADRLQSASGYLRERDLTTMMRETEALARRRPELFLAGSVLAGLVIARFLKSTSRRTSERAASDCDRDAYANFESGGMGEI